MVAKVCNKLDELGIPTDYDQASVIIAAYENYIRNSYEGKHHVVELFGFDWIQGESKNKYVITDGMGRERDSVSGEDVWFVSSAVVKGEFTSANLLQPQPKEKHTCDGCASIGHCTKVVRSPYNGKNERYCNHCMVNDDRLRAEGDPSTCKKCTELMCQYNPNRRVG